MRNFLDADREKGSIFTLFKSSKNIFNVNMQIKFDDKGKFIGVMKNDGSGETISSSDWDEKVQDKYLNKKIDMIKKAIIFSIIFILYSCNSIEIKRQKLIVPENYVGNVFIFYGQKFDKGESQKKGSTVSFYVPDDGVIFTKYKPASFMNEEEYFQNTQKNLSKINNKTKEIIIIGTSLNGIGAPFQMDCSQYIVGLKKEVSTKSSSPTHYIDSLYLSYADSQGNPK